MAVAKAMKFGVFDHVDRAGVPLGQQFEERLRMIEAYDRLAFYAYHVAEHHCTPLGLSPSPGIFLAAAAQRTKRLRLGPLVYSLPLYHPIRLIEGICMLDHLTGGLGPHSSAPHPAPETLSLRMWKQSGADYIGCDVAFGDITFQEAMRTIELIGNHIIPAFATPQKKNETAS
jgi:hypothetical protein